ncbi:MAG: hypothetical protein QJR02_14295 [Sinobacteraceae bacterium]|nr:hypothetical protein [Nevskiaceae bacterium]
MRRRRSVARVLGAVAALELAACGSSQPVQVASGGGVAPAPATPFLAGAAVADITPPPFDPIADAQAFPNCPALYDGPRPFAFEEPYLDVNGNGRFDYGVDLWCDANLNGRWDGIFSSGGVGVQASAVHDPLEARAVAVSDGRTVVVIESIVAQGLFINLIDRIRERARALRPGIADVLVSANHNESSPDTVGIYGAPAVAGTFGARSGLDDDYLAFLVEQAAEAAVAAFDALRPASLWAGQFPLPDDVQIHLSKNFPTTDDQGAPAAVDFKMGILQARDTAGVPIFTLMNAAAHNQEIGHSAALAGQLSADWPGYFERSLEKALPGIAVYLVGDNGSQEDPQTVPPVAPSAGPDCPSGCYAQAQATGEAFARAVQGALAGLEPLRSGSVDYRRAEFFVPLQNNLFKAAVVLGLFGDRPTYLAGVPAGPLGDQLKTAVAVLALGPDFQLLANPGEAFPALMLGSPWGIEDAGCPDRPNPPVPTWHARARFRFQAGLANDFVGYQIPAWAFSATPGVFTTLCVNDRDDQDPKGHPHKLEDEGLGPDESNAMASQLTALLDETPDPAAHIVPGRYVHPDGQVDRKAAGAVAVWLAAPGATKLEADDGRLIALPGIARFGSRAVDAHGQFMDYDGQPQDAPDLATRGMVRIDAGGTLVERDYLDLYPALQTGLLGAAVYGP